MMQKKCVLQTKGFNLSFYFSNKTYNREGVNAIVEFTLDPSSGKLTVRSIPTFIRFQELQRLLTYFGSHIIALKKDSATESNTFVTNGLDFQIKALSGEFDPLIESYFSILCLINTYRLHNEDTSTYVGGESVITFTKTQEFMSELQSVLDDFQNPDKYLPNAE